MYDVCVIGGGAAGLMAAGAAAKRGLKTVILERNEKVGRKVMITGKGRCNVTNNCTLLNDLILNIPVNGRFLFSAFSKFMPADTMDFFENMGVPLKVERGDRVFPESDRASDIVDALRKFALSSGAEVVTGRAKDLIVENDSVTGVKTYDDEIINAKSVIIATGGAGRLHYQGFPTSNHYGATADGLILGYRVGAKLLYADTLQYHPTGTGYPEQIFGALVTEKVRSLGAKLVNIDGDVFMHPLETRDVTAASIIRECTERGKGVETNLGKALWLDTPMIELIHGEGTIEKRIPAMMRMFGKYGIDIRKEPILVYPTLHYQNGGLEISDDCATGVENLYAAGEVAGGIHGRNRLMGNSLLDVIVFGRNAGIYAAAKAKETTAPAKLTLAHIEKFNKELEAAGAVNDTASPMLLPHYARKK